MAACSVVPSESPLHQLIGNVGMHGKVIVHRGGDCGIGPRQVQRVHSARKSEDREVCG